MTAVGYEDYEELSEKHSGIQHSVFLASYWYDGRDTESCLLMGNPHKSTSEVPDRWQAFVRPFRCTLASWYCRPCFSLFIVRGVPFQYAVLVFTLRHPKLSFSQALPGRRASHLIAIRPVNLRRYFSTPVRYVPVAKVNPQIGMESSSHMGFRENLHTARGSILPKKLAVSNLQPLMKPQERNKRR